MPVDFPNRWAPLNARSRYDEKLKRGEENLKFIDELGAQMGKICVGDGIAKIIAQDGRLYVSYFGDAGSSETSAETSANSPFGTRRAKSSMDLTSAGFTTATR